MSINRCKEKLEISTLTYAQPILKIHSIFEQMYFEMANCDEQHIFNTKNKT